MKIPFFNLQRENTPLIEELKEAVSNVMISGHYILGKELNQFENNFAQYVGTKYCIGVGNGLDALVLSLRALNIEKGDEVIVPAHTFIATWLAVSQVDATIIPVEPDEFYNISDDDIESKITEKSKAIIPVHLYGRPANMQKINTIAKRHSLYVIEDAAQAQGSSIETNKCGNLGDIAAFSFYPAKNLGAFGDAGAITTNSSELFDKILSLRNYGSRKKYDHRFKGVNTRLDEIQAVILNIKLKYLDKSNEVKNCIAKRYLKEIKNHNIILPMNPKNETFIAWHQFVVKVINRNSFINYMEKRGIDTLIHYPIPPHESGAYNEDFKNKNFPITSNLCQSIVSIPIYAALTKQEIDYIIKTINNYE